jgi:hypothetical protein
MKIPNHLTTDRLTILRRIFQPWVLALLFFIALSIFATWPVWPNVNRQFAGENDAFQLISSTITTAGSWQWDQL